MVKWLFVLVGLCLSTVAWATSAELVLLAPTLEQGQVGAITVRVTGARPTAPPAIQVVPSEGIRLRFERQGQQVNIVNSKVTRLYEYTYRVQALEPGNYTIGPADIEVGTQHVLTESKSLVVKPRSKNAATELSVSAGFSVTEGYIGQVVTYSREIQSRLPISREEWTTPPLNGLVPPRDAEPFYQDYRLPDAEGETHIKAEKHALVLSTPGTRDVPASVVRLRVVTGNRGRGAFAMRETRLEVVGTEPAELNVLPLPPAPPGFSGLVGDFEVTAKLDRDSAAVGETVRRAILLRGDGALESFKLPKTNGIKGARFYDGSPATTARVKPTGFHAEGRYEQVIVPTEIGELRIPPMDVITFSPTTRRYVTATIDGAVLTVRRGKGGNEDYESFVGAGDLGDSDAVLVEDLYEGVRDVHTAGAVHSMWIGGFMPWMLLLTALPIVTLGAWEGQGTARRLWRERPRREKAVKDVTPQQRLRALPADPVLRLAELDAALRDALARHAGVPLATLDRAAVTDNLPGELHTAVSELTRDLDRTRFAGASAAGLEDRVKQAVRDLQQAPKGDA